MSHPTIAKTSKGSAVVIGAGVGGLAVAARLAAAGWSVDVFEQASTVGGKLGLYERDGFRFDTGPSIVTMPHVFEDLFAATGAPLSLVLQLRKLDPIARYRFGDGTWLDAPSDDASFVAAAESMRAGNGQQLQRFLDRSRAIWDATHETFLESALRPLDLVLQSRRLNDLRTIAPWKSMRTLTSSMLDDSRLVSFVDRYATYTGSDPRKAPAALASITHAERGFGGWYIEGGLRLLGSALVERCESLGVSIHVDSSVGAITVTRDGAANGVVVGGERRSADIVVANTDAQHLYSALLPSSPRVRRAQRRLRRSQPSLSGFVMCLAVDRTTPADYAGELVELAHHTVLFPENYDQEFDDLFGTHPKLVRDPTIYISAPSDPAVAPAGSEAWFVLVNGPRHMPGEPTAGIDWQVPGLADSYADRLLDLMAERGIDVRRHVRWRELRTPADLAARTRSVGGSIYGTSSNGARSAFLRPANRSPIRGLYLVGGSSHPGGGLPLVTLSAQIVAALVETDFSSPRVEMGE